MPDGAKLPRVNDLPDSIAGLAVRPAFEIIPESFDRDLKPLLEELSKTLPASRLSGVYASSSRDGESRNPVDRVKAEEFGSLYPGSGSGTSAVTANVCPVSSEAYTAVGRRQIRLRGRLERDSPISNRRRSGCAACPPGTRVPVGLAGYAAMPGTIRRLRAQRSHRAAPFITLKLAW